MRIRHEGGYRTLYAHLSESVPVIAGNEVAAGAIIGYSGNTGNSTAPHLHLTLKRDGATAAGETVFSGDIVDPTPFLEALENVAE